MRTPLAARLLEARNLAEVGARELDRLAGITEGHTSLIESGRVVNVSAHTLAKLASALGLSLDWLVNGHGDGPTREQIAEAVGRAGRPDVIAS